MNIEEGYEFRSVHRCLGFRGGAGEEGRRINILRMMLLMGGRGARLNGQVLIGILYHRCIGGLSVASVLCWLL